VSSAATACATCAGGTEIAEASGGGTVAAEAEHGAIPHAKMSASA